MNFGPHSTLMLVDASSFVFRAHFASQNSDPVYNTAPDGSPVGAIRLFTERCYWFRKNGVNQVRPTHAAMVFDHSRRSFRHSLFEGYKSHRPATPEDLKSQLPIMREAAAALGFLAVEMEGMEADDLICTYALTAAEMGGEVVIVSADKDLLQILRPGVSMFDPEIGLHGMPGYRPARLFSSDEDVIAKMGVPPRLLAQAQALSGDPGDGIPGVPGIGPKRAAELIMEHGSLEAVLAAAHDMPPLRNGGRSKVAQNLIDFADQARLSLKLASLCTTVPYETCVEEMILGDVDYQQGIDFCTRYNLASMANRLQEDWTWAPKAW